MQRPQPRKRDEESTRKDLRPVIGPPSYGPRRPIKQPCKYFANGGCGRGDQCWFSHDPQVFHVAMERSPPQRPMPERSAPAPERHQPAPDRPRDNGTPGRQQFIKRMLADLVSQKAQRDASSQKDKGAATSTQSAGQDSLHPADSSNSSQKDQVAATRTQSAGKDTLHPANSSSSSRKGEVAVDSPHSARKASTHPVENTISQSTAGRSEVQQIAHSHSLAPVPATSSKGNVGPPGVQQDGVRDRPASAEASSGAASDRGVARQQKVPYVPVVPETDARYKTVLCIYHKQGRCPRGNTCSFAHDISELRKKPTQQVKAGLSPGHAAASVSSGPVDGGAKPFESRAPANAQPDSRLEAAAPVQDHVQAAGGHAKTSIEKEPATQVRKQQHSLPPIIQQLLSKTAKYKPPAPDVPGPAPASTSAPASTFQAPAVASSAPLGDSCSDRPIPQAVTCIAQRLPFMQGSRLSALPGGVPQFGSMPPLPPPKPEALFQGSFGGISQHHLMAALAPASRSQPSMHISDLLQAGTPHSSGPAEHCIGPVSQMQPHTAQADKPAEVSPGLVQQSVRAVQQGPLPATPLNGHLQPQQPDAFHGTMPETSASMPAMHRPQPVKRPQPGRKPYAATGLSPRPQPGARAPPPGFVPAQACAPRPPSASSLQSAQSAARREPDKAPPWGQQPESLEPVKASLAAGTQQGHVPIVAPGSCAASDSSQHSASTDFGKEARPEAVGPPGNFSFRSSNEQHSQPAGDGMTQHHKAAYAVTVGAAHSNAFHSTPSKKLHKSQGAPSGEDVDVPHSFCCPITQELMRNPVVAADGHTYEASAIASWLESHDTSPMTNDEMSSKFVAPNNSLKAVIGLLFPVC